MQSVFEALIAFPQNAAIPRARASASTTQRIDNDVMPCLLEDIAHLKDILNERP